MVVDWNYSALSRLSFVSAKHGTNSVLSYASHWRTNIDLFDVSLMAGEIRGDAIMGLSVMGQIGQIDVRSEMIYAKPDEISHYGQAVLGAGYTFTNSFSVNVEYYFNGLGKADKDIYDFNELFTAKVQSLGRQYLGTIIGFDITPLIRWDNYLIYNINDESLFLFPYFTYSLVENIELNMGSQLFYGANNSEYGRFSTFYNMQVQWFF